MKKSIRIKHQIRRRARALRILYGSEFLSRLVCENIFYFVRSQFSHVNSIGCYNSVGSEVNLSLLFSRLSGLSVPMVSAESMFFERKIQLALIPVVAFDPLGNRLGQGGGYYDRFLAGKSIVRIGVAYSFQCFDSFPVTKQDEKMDYVATERGIQSFKHLC